MPTKPTDTNFMDLAQFGGGGLTMGEPVTGSAFAADPVATVSTKQQSVSQKSLMKQALFGSPDEQQMIATGIQQDALMAEDEGLRDLQSMDQLAFAVKYGVDAARKRSGFDEVFRRLEDLKSAERSGSDVVKDAAIDTGVMVANTVGSALALGAAGVDQVAAAPARVANAIAGEEVVAQPPALSNLVSKGLEAVTEYGQSNQSELMQQRRMQQALEGAIMADDNETQYQEELTENADGNAWDRSIAPWIRKQGRDFGDAIANYADDPIMAGSLVPEAVGSLLPATGAIKVVGRSRALKKAMAEGRSRKEAGDFLKTKEGRDLVAAESIRMAPVIIGATEGGAAVTQTQQAIFAMDEEELNKSDEYREMIESGLSTEEAQMRLARDAGTAAGALALPGAIASGGLSARFAAAPLSTGAKGTKKVTAGARNIASETVEEGLQEANSSLASNAAQIAVADLDVDLDEGVAAAAAEGALGGVAMAGTLQAPAIAAGVAADAGKKAAEGTKAAVNKRLESVDNNVDDTSVVGRAAQSEARKTMREAGEAVITALPSPEPTTEDATEAADAPVSIKQTIERGVFLEEDEAEAYAEKYPMLREMLDSSENGKLERSMAVAAADMVLQDKDADENTKIDAAMDLLVSFDDMKRIDNEETQSSIDTLPEGDPGRASYDLLKNQLTILENNKMTENAENVLRQMTPEKVAEVVPLDMLSDPETAPEVKQAIGQMLDTISRVNPMAVKPEYLDMVLDQVGGGRAGELLKKRLQVAKDIVNEFREVDAAKDKILAEQQNAVKDLPEKSAEDSLYKTFDIVRNEINVEGNQKNGLPSLIEHRRRIAEAAAAGRVTEAQDNLGELASFALGQVNKVAALNANIAQGSGRAKAQKFNAYNGEVMFEQSPVWVDPSNPASIAQAKATYVDAQSAVSLAQKMAELYGLEIQQDLALQELALNTNEAPSVSVSDEVVEPAPVEAEPVTEPTLTEVAKQAAKEEKAEPQAEEVAPVVEPTEKGIVPWFKELKTRMPTNTSGSNALMNAFKPRKDASTLTEFESPVAYVSENIGQLVTEQNALSRELSDDEAQAVSDIVTETLPKWLEDFDTNMNAMIAKRDAGVIKKNKEKGENAKTWSEMLDEGQSDILNYESGMVLNLIVDKDGDDFKIDRTVLEGSFLAGMDWVVENAGRGGQNLDDERVSQMFGMGRTGIVTEEMREQSQYGIPLQSAIEGLANKIQDMLGVSPNKDAPLSETQGLFRALAANVFEVMLSDKRAIQEKTLYYQVRNVRTDKMEPRQMTSLKVGEPLKNDSSIQNLKGLGNVFGQIFIKEGTKTRYVGSAPRDVNRETGQIRNNLSTLSDKAVTAINRLQKMPSYVNTPMTELFDVLGDDLVGNLLGLKDVTPDMEKRTNKTDLTSIKGKNLSIIRGLEQSRLYVSEARNQGDETPIFFQWKLSSVGRLQQDGPVTPQGDKIARELISATNSTLDLSTPEHQYALWLAVAQSLDVSIEKMSHEDAIAEAQDLITSPTGLLPVLDMLQDWLTNGDLDQQQFQKAMKEAKDFKGRELEITPKLIHAVLTVARANEAMGTDGETSFKTALALEADGKTDGPINAMIHMGTELFDAEEIERFAKGGLFFTDEKLSLNEFIKTEHARHKGKKVEGEDLYHMAAASFQELLTENLRLIDDPLKKTMWVLNALLPDFTLGEKNPETNDYEPIVGRNVIKNPLTVFLYGSGDKGISNKITSAVADQFYKIMSEVASGMEDGTMKSWKDHPVFWENPGLVEAMSDLMRPESPESNEVDKLIRQMNNPVKAKLSEESLKNLSNAVLTHFAEPMLEAVNVVTGGLASKMKKTQALSQIQTLILQDLFQQAQDGQAQVNAEEGRVGVSENDLRETFIDVMNMAPIYESQDQSFHIAAAKRETLNTAVSVTFGGKLKTMATGIRPADASVKASPYLTIGVGDGQMMLNIYGNQDSRVDNSLAVFDGVEQPLDKIQEASEFINESVWDAWMQSNVYQIVSDGYGQMTNRLTPKMYESLSDDTKKAISRTMGRKKGDPVPKLKDIQDYGMAVASLALEAQARKNAMASMAVQVDHMAGVESSHGREGLVAAEGDPLAYEAISEILNVRTEEEMEKLESETTAKRSIAQYAQAPDSKLMQQIKAIGEDVDGKGKVRKMNGAQVLALLEAAENISPEQVTVLKKILSGSKDVNDTAYYFGNGKDLEAVRAKYHKDTGKRPIELGQTHIGENVAFIANVAPETILHEMLHAKTAAVVARHYADPQSSPETVQIAVRQLESLMSEFWKIRDSTPAQTVMREQMKTLQGRKPEQMLEFIAYMLSNQDLIDVSKKTTNYKFMGRIIKAGLRVLKKLLGLTDADLPSNKIWDQVRFSTEVLVSSPALGTQDNVDLVLAQVYGQDARLDMIEGRFLNQMDAAMAARQKMQEESGVRTNVDADLLKDGREALNLQGRKSAERAMAGGFELNPREQQAYQAVHAVMQSGVRLDASVLRQINALYNHVSEVLKTSDLENDGQTERVRAKMQHAFLVGARGMRQDSEGRSDLLASFMALAQTSPELRDVLSKMKPPKAAELSWGSIDEAVVSISNLVMSLITRLSFSRPDVSSTVTKEMDKLTVSLSNIQGERRYMAALNSVGEMTDKLNQRAANALDDVSRTVSDNIAERASNTNNRFLKSGMDVAALVTSLGSKTAAADRAEGITTMLNSTDGWNSAREILDNLRGMTKTNATILRSINKVKYFVDKVRQDFREGVPENLARKFSRKLTRQEWSAMHLAVGKTDLLGLGLQEALDVMKDPKSLASRINAAEEKVNGVSPRLANRYIRKAKSLAMFNMTGQTDTKHLLKNTRAIALLLGERDRPSEKDIGPGTEEAIGDLIALYSYDMAGQDIQDLVQNLAETEQDGIETIAGLQASFRAMELGKVRSGTDGNIALNNGWQGWLPSTSQGDTEVVVEDDLNHKEMVMKGYTRIGAYVQDRREGSRTTKSYYQSSTAGRATYRQGIAQTVHTTYSGVNSMTGASLSQEMAGTFRGAKAKRVGEEAATAPVGSLDGQKTGTYLIPIFDQDGKVSGYERPMDPAMTAGLQNDTHMGRMMGVWGGRIMEEEASNEFNRDLLRTLKTIHEDAKLTGRQEEFVNVADKNTKDAVMRDTWETMGFQMKKDAAEIFGRPNYLPVRRDMLNDALGYRAASIMDPWNGVSRFSDTTQKAIRDTLTFIGGAKTYTALKHLEGFVQEGVSFAKTTIIVRSLVVGVQNIASNVLHLSLRGVNVATIATKGREKMVEINQFVKNQEKIQTLQIEYAAQAQNPKALKILKGRIKALEDSSARLSIAPLIEAGEFSTISENLTEADIAVREGKFFEYIEKAVDRLPNWLGQVSKNIAITKDTELFQGLNRMVQYGDFVAKAVLYDHLKKQGMDERQILDEILEEFVQYNRLPGRGRDFLESTGLLWFWNYKLRIMKVTAKMMRERPLSSLLMMGQVGPNLDVDSVASGSLGGAYVSGSLGYSIGPEMGVDAWLLNPWVNLTT